jgi:hypothetical protein
MILIPSNRPPTHPGEMLLEEFLTPLAMSQRYSRESREGGTFLFTAAPGFQPAGETTRTKPVALARSFDGPHEKAAPRHSAPGPLPFLSFR